MPKASPLQPSFSGGEFSPRIYGRTDSERYKTGLSTCLNYLPTTQGPLVRRPGFKYVADAKDPSKPPAFLEFKFNQTQNYVLEMGDKYIRFYTNGGQITTTSTRFQVSGYYGTSDTPIHSTNFYAMRTSPNQLPGELLLSSSVINASSVLEITSPYSYLDVSNIKIAQKDDTLYMVHSSYPEYKLTRAGSELWTLKRVLHIDGPYLPLNSYRSTGDNLGVTIITGAAPFITSPAGVDQWDVTTGPKLSVAGVVVGSSNLKRVTTSANHNLQTGNKVVILDVTGSTDVNNGTSSIASMFWEIIKVNNTVFDLVGSANTGFAYTGSGSVYPALFEPYQSPTTPNDIGRGIALYRQDGGRAFGRFDTVTDMARARIVVDKNFSPAVTGTSANGIVSYWQMQPWSLSNGYPSTVSFHQDRHFLAGAPQYPQRIDASKSSNYEVFQASGSSLIVADDSALSFNLNSADLNRINWIKSDTQGLLAGSFNSEWNITPNNQGAALTPTNISAAQTSYFGSDSPDAVQTGNATLYVQRAQRRVRELNYFFQVNTYRSTDLAELSDHLTYPGISKLSVQKETIPAVWGLRTDGQLISMVYSRDDQTLKVGWARHQLGGQSDSGGSAPVVKAMAVIPSPNGAFDQVWTATQRFINGTSVVQIEALTKPYDDSFVQEDAFQVDCGGTYDSPITITGISTGGSAVVTAAAHGLANGDSVKITSVVGLNSSVVNVMGVTINSNLVNGMTFQVTSASTNAFFLQDFSSNYINSLNYSAYVSGGQARKLVSTISGLTWLKGETVQVLADGGIHPATQINSAGVLAMSYPAAKVQIGYGYNSDARTLRPDAGAADGTAIGKMRRVARAALMLNNVGELSIGPNFTRLTPFEFTQADQQQADLATPLFSGIIREGVESEFDFDGQICWRQSGPLPGMVQALTIMLEENDV